MMMMMTMMMMRVFNKHHGQRAFGMSCRRFMVDR